MKPVSRCTDCSGADCSGNGRRRREAAIAPAACRRISTRVRAARHNARMRTFAHAPLLAVFLTCGVFAPLCATAVESRLVHAGDADYRVVTVDLGAETLDLYWLDAGGKAYGSIEALRRGGEAGGRTLLFATNAGIYDQSDRPLGLTIAGGKTLRSLNTTKARGGSRQLRDAAERRLLRRRTGTRRRRADGRLARRSASTRALRPSRARCSSSTAR